MLELAKDAACLVCGRGLVAARAATVADEAEAARDRRVVRHMQAGNPGPRSLTGEQVREIRRRHENEGAKQSVLALEFRVSQAIVNQVVRYQTYRDVGD